MSDTSIAQPDSPAQISTPSVAAAAPTRNTYSLRKRARAACSFCQWRKIRCNLWETNPCSNCRIEQIPCSMGEPRKRRTVSKKIRPPQTTLSLTSLASSVTQTTQPTCDDNILPSSPNPPNPPHLTTQAGREQNANPPDDDCPSSVQTYRPTLNQATPVGYSQEYFSQPAPYWPPLPAYVKGPPARLTLEDLRYLSNRGALTIPTAEFRDALVCAYTDFIHPYMPLIDLNDFVSSITEITSNKNPTSLLLFQAVMFAGSAHVDIRPLRSMGFLTRKAARRALFNRVKILYEFEYEEHRISIIQALVLMSLWCETPDDQKDPYHWLNIALSLARRAGLDRANISNLIPEKELRLRKRIWWSCVIRDPLVSLGLKRSLNISVLDYDVPMLSFDDCDTKEESYEALKLLGYTWKEEKSYLLGLLTVAQARLHLCLSQILESQYSLCENRKNRSGVSGHSSTSIMVPVTTEEAQTTMLDCETNLELWYHAVPMEIVNSKSTKVDSNPIFAPVEVFRTVLHMTYHTSIITLYRPWLTLTKNGYTAHTWISNKSLKDKAETAVRQAAQTITDMAMQLHVLDLTRHLPQTGLSALVAAVVIHIGNAASIDPSLQASGLRGFEHCSHILNELRENFYLADFSSEFANLTARAMNIGNTNPSAVSGVDPVASLFDRNGHFIGRGTDCTQDALTSTSYPSRPQPDLYPPMDMNSLFDHSMEVCAGAQSSLVSTTPAQELNVLNHYQHLHNEMTRILANDMDMPDWSLQTVGSVD